MSDYSGFLTTADREFLRGERTYDSAQGRYDRREAIRQRTRQALDDFALLYEELPPEERNKIFDPPEDEVRDLSEDLRRTIAFIYRALKGEVDTLDVVERSYRENFDDVLVAAIQRAEFDRHHATASTFVKVDPPTVTVNEHPPQVDIDRFVDELVKDGGRELGPNELRAMLLWATRTTVEPDPINDPGGRSAFDLHDLAERVEKEARENAGQE